METIIVIYFHIEKRQTALTARALTGALQHRGQQKYTENISDYRKTTRGRSEDGTFYNTVNRCQHLKINKETKNK